jgi:hypothetical protein
VIDEEGRAVLKARKGKERRASALALEAAIEDRLPERSLLDILARVSRFTGWHRHFGPLSGSEPKLADPLARYILVAFTYGYNLGPSQAARHLRGLVTAYELGAIARRHVTVEKQNQALAEVVNRFAQLDLARLWGDGSSVVADGTKYEIYVDNLLAEYHIRYGGLWRHRLPPRRRQLHRPLLPLHPLRGVGGGLHHRGSASELERRPARHDPCRYPRSVVPGLRTRLPAGLRLGPPDPGLEGADLLPGRRLIETHWQDLMRVVLSIREGRLSSVTLLRRLRYDSKRNRVYRAFRELGRVIATITLLRTISDPEMRERTGRAMNMVESYNGFAKWIFFGNEG